MLEINDIDVFYGRFQALRGLSLKVGDEETIGLFGPNGHGKTTILKTISGLLTPAKGSIEFEGKEISGLTAPQIASLGIMHVPQGRRLFQDMTVLENLLLGAYTSRAWKNRKENLRRVYEIFPRLQERKNQLGSTLSGGERQMVAIGRGLMGSAKLLMLDEPLEGLAPSWAIDLRKKIREIKETTKMSMILVDENVEFVTELAERIYLIQQGEVSLEGKKEDILNIDYVKEAYLGRV